MLVFAQIDITLIASWCVLAAYEYVATSLGFSLWIFALFWVVRSFFWGPGIRVEQTLLQRIAPFVARLISYLFIVSGFLAWIDAVCPPLSLRLFHQLEASMIPDDVAQNIQDPLKLLQEGLDVGDKGRNRMSEAGALWIAACLIDNVWNFIFTSIATSCFASHIMGHAFKVKCQFLSPCPGSSLRVRARREHLQPCAWCLSSLTDESICRSITRCGIWIPGNLLGFGC